MPHAEALEFFRGQLLEHCVNEDSHLNYIKVVMRKADGGTGLYCVHDFYSRYSLSAGSRGPSLSRFVDHWRVELRQHKVTRVGVWGSDADDSGAWFSLK